MRDRAYWLAGPVAWPAFAWCIFELVLRAGAGYTPGLGGTLLTAACAGGTVVAVTVRRGALRIAVQQPRRTR